jgi:hypothetical protein
MASWYGFKRVFVDLSFADGLRNWGADHSDIAYLAQTPPRKTSKTGAHQILRPSTQSPSLMRAMATG